jgi:phosphatidylserine/phosphatidylglycerophosphate/cardiolipin synthase-like enzyme
MDKGYTLTMRPMIRWQWFSGAAVPLLAVSVWAGTALRDAFVERIDAAKSSIEVLVYSIRAVAITDALAAAAKRGVRVRVIVDAMQTLQLSPEESELADAGVSLRRVRGSEAKFQHDKFIVFDGELAATPHYNLSRSAAKAAGSDTSAFTKDRVLIQQFEEQFEKIWRTSEIHPESE